MKIESYSCDCCGKRKEVVNNWFVAERTQVGFSLHTWLWAEHEDELDNRCDRKVEGTVHVHLCGMDCAIRQISEWLGELNGPLLEAYKQRLVRREPNLSSATALTLPTYLT